MTELVDRPVLGSMLKIKIASAFVECPGLENLEVDPGANITVKKSGINKDYVRPVATGVRDTGTLSGDVLRDPLHAVHMFLATAMESNGTTVVEALFVQGDTGVETPLKFILTKFPMSAKQGDTLMGKLEGEITEQIDWNTSAPV